MEFFEIASLAESFSVYGDPYKHYLWAFMVIGACCFAILFLLEGIALYTIAGKEGFKNRWMAFVPFLNTYYIGVVSEKNKIFKAKAKYVSLVAALLEVVYCVLGALYYAAEFKIFGGGYAVPEYHTVVSMGSTVEIPYGYNAVNLPESLNWAWWIMCNLQDYVIYWVQLVYMVCMVFVLVSFFRTYSSPRYVLFSIICVLLPVKGIIMFAVRNNKGKNYLEYVKEQQRRQYRMYQEYMRGSQNMQGGNGFGGYSDQYGTQNDPYGRQSAQTPPDDPFGGLGGNQSGSAQSGGSTGSGLNGSGDPFDDFK